MFHPMDMNILALIVPILVVSTQSVTCFHVQQRIIPRSNLLFQTGVKNANKSNVEVITDNDDDMSKEEYDWLPDREKARIARENSWRRAEADLSTLTDNNEKDDTSSSSSSEDARREQKLTYTDEEEELISILGGKDDSNSKGKRESGFLGDSSLREISMDFQVPICYLGDVLCSWGVPPPIDPNTMLGDMVTGEQAFAILEAIHTLDVGSLNDRYADFDLATLCNEYDIELSDGFELAIKEGWNLPFGVRTFLRVEQEEFLIEKLAKDIW